MYAVFDRWLGAGDRWSRKERPREPPPTILISASASWTIKQSNGSLDALDEYRRNLSGIAVLMDKLSKAGTQVRLKHSTFHLYNFITIILIYSLTYGESMQHSSVDFHSILILC